MINGAMRKIDEEIDVKRMREILEKEERQKRDRGLGKGKGKEGRLKEFFFLGLNAFTTEQGGTLCWQNKSLFTVNPYQVLRYLGTSFAFWLLIFIND